MNDVSEGDQNVFKREDEVTISGTYRAKGNEAVSVYVTGMDALQGGSGSLATRRNNGFVALTRTKAWNTITTQNGPIANECHQIANEIIDHGEFTFLGDNIQAATSSDDTSEQDDRQRRLVDYRLTESAVND